MTAFRDSAKWSGAPGSDVAGPFDAMIRALAEVPRPRPVRLSRWGKTTAAVTSAALMAALGGYVTTLVLARRALVGQSAGPPQFPLYALSIAFIVVFALVMLNVIARQKQLLAEGEMATALVTKHWLARHGPRIRYEFTTPLGEHFSRGASDGSRQLTEGMNVPIFYDPRKPKRQLALCASFYEVILPGQE